MREENGKHESPEELRFEEEMFEEIEEIVTAGWMGCANCCS
ncbi:hypothetical protein [Saccharibacillus sp. O23]|nr:hypothetical protein [Saccharibacillus sp. O23]